MPVHITGNARNTVRTSVKFARRQGGERSIFEPGEVFCPDAGEI